MMWTQKEAIELVTEIEKVCPSAGCHIALTGGALYKKGPRKDIDIIFYRIRQVKEIDTDKLFKLLDNKFDITIVGKYGWMCKAKCRNTNRGIDILFPDSSSNNPYPSKKDLKFFSQKIVDVLNNL